MNAQVKIPDLAELVLIEDKDALATFTTPGALDPILAHVRRHIDAFRADASTAEGRAEIKSMAFAVTKSKTALKAIGDKLAKDAKDLPKKIDAGRRKVEDTLDAWRDEVRKPLTDWETAEDARIERHSRALETLKAIPPMPPGSVEDLTAKIAEVEAVSDGADREEFQDGFRLAKAAALASLAEKLVWRRNYEAEQAELAQLRAEREAREAAERERQRAEAAAQAAAQAERDRQAAIAAAEAEAERKATEAAQRAAREAEEAAARREADLKAQAEAAERRAREAEAKAKAEIEAKAAAERAEQERREKDKAHRGRVNLAAVAAMVRACKATGLTDEQAKAVLTAIIRGEVPAVSISY